MAGEFVFLDTSGVLAYLDADDAEHLRSVAAWNRVLEERARLLMTDWVRLECWSLVQRRLGIEAVKDFYGRILPGCAIDGVGEERFAQLARLVLLTPRRGLSLVDVASFDCMQRHGIQRALAFDEHFGEHGFITPESPAW